MMLENAKPLFSEYAFTALERFLRYVQIDTQSDTQSGTTPSSEKQKQLSALLAKELQELGIADAHSDEYGYVYATIPANTPKKVPTICFCSHVDTAPDCSGYNVKPIVHKNYQGQEIVLPDDPKQVLRLEDYPHLKTVMGHDLVTASGKTLLGSDDKAGVAEIMDFVHFLMKHQDVKHGPIKILFTPDEEVGRGADHVDLKKLGADFGYTVDGGALGSIDQENFSADKVIITLHGVIAHPGSAKGKLVNALKLASEVINKLPKSSLSPETTEAKEGFIHPVRMEGIAETCTIECIIRDFETSELAVKEELLKNIVKEVLKPYPQCHFEFEVIEQYRNMKEVLEIYPHVVDHAKKAIARAGLEVLQRSIRGGTDGARLSFMGLPCPNLCAAQQAIHSKLEYISVQEMNKVVEILVHLACIWEE